PYGAPGEPELPHLGHQLLLPPGEEIVAVRLENAIWTLLPGEHRLYPAQPPVPYSHLGEQEFTPPDAALYASDALFPAQPVEMFRTDFLSGHGIGSVSVTAARYTPASGRVEVLTQYMLIAETAPTSRAQTAHAAMLKRTQRVNERVVQRVENPEALALYPATDEVDEVGCRYLIITATELEPVFQVLAEHKTQLGWQAEIALVEDITMQYTGLDLADKIRNCVIDYYQGGDLEYVLLGGDTEFVPKRGLYASIGSTIDEDIPADLYFSNLDGNWNTDGDSRWGESNEADLIAEVAIGRMPADNITEALNLVEKTIAYETAPVAADLEKALMLGEDLGWWVWGGEYKEEIRLGSSMWGYTTLGFPTNFSVSVLYDMYIPWSGIGDLLPALNNGMNLVNHLGHCNNTYAMKFSESQINDVNCTNDGVNHNFYLLYSQGCYAAAFDNRTESGYYTIDAIAEKFTIIEHGAVAFVGNSRYGWGSYSNTDGDSQYYDREFFDAMFFEQKFKLGWVNADSKEDNIPRLGNASYWCYYELNVLGDPALDIWTDAPQTFAAITYPDPILLGTDEVVVNTGVYGAQAALISGDQVLGYSVSDGAGLATILLDDPIIVPGSLTLSVTHHNYLPFQAIIQAVPTNGPHVVLTQEDYFDVNGGDGDGNPDLGETLDFTFSFQNVGVDPAYGLYAIFSCADNCVQILQDSAYLGDLPVDSSYTLEDIFQAALLPTVQDEQTLNFLVTVRDNVDSTWIADFDLTAFAPGLQLVAWDYDDGNNQRLTPGETVDLELDFVNQGGQETENLTVWLSTDNPMVSILSEPAALSPLQPGQQATLSDLQFTINPAMPNPSAFVVYVTALDTRDYQEGFLIELPVGGEFEDMETGAPNWTHSNVTPGFGDQWNLSTIINHTPGGSHAWYCGSYPYYSSLLDAALITPQYEIHGSHELRFYHWMSAQLATQYQGYAYDGGLVEMSLNGAPFELITPE
ncbi:MAG: C25 family cysteine peptidase, partial [bacterium]